MKFKRFGSLVMALAMAMTMTACGEKPAPEEPIPEEPSVETIAPVEQPEPEPAPEPEPEPVPEPEPMLPYTNPLTGEGSETDVGKARPIAIMLNNHKKAVPQAGVSQADVIYEIPAEGGITRMLGLFQSVEGVGEIGTVRSARDYYVSLALGHDAVYMHAGGSPQAYAFIKEWGVTALDCVNGPYEGTLYWRDKTRKANAGLEHSVMTSGAKITELLPTYKNMRLDHKDGYVVGWTFSDEPHSENAVPANKITVPFSSYKTGIFTYDETSGLYMVEEYGKAYVDANTNEQVGVKNVLVLYTDVAAIKGDAAGRLTVRTTGEGKGLLFRDGTVQSITWKRTSDKHTLEFYGGNGQRADLAVGTSYINILDESDRASWE